MSQIDDVDSEVGRKSGSIDFFLETKLHWPRVREGWVDRHRLVDLFDQATRRPVTLVSAPAGYGKTTLSAQWLASARGNRSAAWVALDAADNDPGRLWTHVSTALERAGCARAVEAVGITAGNCADLIGGVLPRIVNALAAEEGEVVLILDDFHYLLASACLEQVAFLIEHLPEQAHLVLISRADPGLRLGRLRASGLLAEIRAEQLSFNAEEATAVLDAERVTLSPTVLGDLLGRTEGWPAGIYLASLSLADCADPDEVVRGSTGNDRFVNSYFWEEVLSQDSDRVRDFVFETSILDRFCAPLCDAVARITGSAQLLEELAGRNLFLVPLDGQGRWYRFHHLFAAVARSELEARYPDRVPQLHERAANWYQANGHVDEAISQFRAAGQRGTAARLVQANWLTFVDAGRAPTVHAWLQSLGPVSGQVDPAEGVTAAWLAAMLGDEAGLAQHMKLLEEFADHGPLPDGTRSVESALCLIRALFGPLGPTDMRAGAKRAVELETDGTSPFYAMAHLGLGHAAYLAGELNLATETFAKAAGSQVAPAIIRLQAMGLQSMTEGELGRPAHSLELAERAIEVVDAHHLHAMPHASVAFTALGQAQAAAGNVGDAMATLEQALTMRLRHPAGPWIAIHHLMAMSRVAVQAGEIAMARELLEELSNRMSRFPDGMTTMRAKKAAIESALRDRIADGMHEEDVTARELEVLRLLQGSLSIREIGTTLHLSPNTVKTHIQALYRKLAAHSRQEAVAIASRDRLI